MKRFLILAAVVAGLVAVAAVVAVPLVLSSDIVRERIADQIAHITGRSVTFSGEPEISLYPYLTVRLHDVVVGNPPGVVGEPFIAMDELVGKVEIWPLLAGRTEIAEFRLVRPRISLRVTAEGSSNWSLKQGAIGTQAAKSDAQVISDETAPPSPRADIRLGRFLVEGGTIRYDSERSGRHEEMTGVGIDFAWPSTASAVSGTGRFTWRGETVEFSGSIAAPQQIISGGSTPVRFSFASAPVRITFDGTALRLDNMQVTGETTISTASTRRLLEWTGTPMGAGSILGAGSIRGKLNWAGSSAAFTEARLELDGNAADGAITVTMVDGRPDIQGTLAFGKLDLSPYVEAVRAAVLPDGPWADAPAAMPFLGIANVDLRISAETLVVGKLQMAQAAAVAAMKDGVVNLTLGDFALYDGRGNARLTAQTGADGTLSAAIQGNLRAVAARKLLASLADVTALDGTAAASLDLTAAGRTWGELAASASGSGSISLANGSISGISLPDLPALAGNPAAATGSTAFTSLGGSFVVRDGLAESSDLRAEGNGYALALSGKAWLHQPGVEARGTLSLPPTAGQADGRAFPFLVDGTWQQPLVRPDLESLIGGDGGPAPAAPIKPPNG